MAIAFRAATAVPDTRPTTFTIPSTVQPGDLMMLAWAVIGADSSLTPTKPDGWEIVPEAGVAGTVHTDASTTAVCWWRIAQSGDAGTDVIIDRPDDTTFAKSGALLVAYSGVDGSDPFHVTAYAADSTNHSGHPMPTVDTTIADCMIVSMLIERVGSPATTTWTFSGGLNNRQTLIPNNTVAIDGAAGDYGTHAAGDGLGGGTITSDAATNHAFTWTAALKPATATQTSKPITAIISSGWTFSPVPDEGVDAATLLADGDTNTFWESGIAPADQPGEVLHQELQAVPASYGAMLSTAGGATSGSATVELWQGDTVIASKTTTVDGTPAWYDFQLSEAEQGAIDTGNLDDLRVYWEVTSA